MSVIAVLFGLVIGVAGQAISAFRVRQQEAAFDILAGALEDFAQQNSLKFLRHNKGANPNTGEIAWKNVFGKYPPMDLSRVYPPLNSNPRTDRDMAGQTLHRRIRGDYLNNDNAQEFPPIIDVGYPGNVVTIQEDNPDASEFDYDDTESFLFYLKFYAPSLEERLERLPAGMLTNLDLDWVDINGNGNGDAEDIELFELRDVWGNPVLYINDARDRTRHGAGPGSNPDGHIDNRLIEMNNGKPVFVSPGPDGYFTIKDEPSDLMDAPPADPLADNVYSIPSTLVVRILNQDDGYEYLTNLLRYDFTENRWKPED